MSTTTFVIVCVMACNISWRDRHALFNLIDILKQDGLSHEWVYMREQNFLKLSLKIKHTPLFKYQKYHLNNSRGIP